MRIGKRKNKKTKNKATHQVTLGSLYDINKNIVENNVETLTIEELTNKKPELIEWLKTTNNRYYMMLCNELKDYTVFHLKDMADPADLNYTGIIDVLIDECLPNRGLVKAVDLTENKDAIEIWIVTDGAAHVYYMFPYDAAIVEA